jgi:hypothetical protein
MDWWPVAVLDGRQDQLIETGPAEATVWAKSSFSRQSDPLGPLNSLAFFWFDRGH